MLQQITTVNARNNFSDLLGQVYYGGKRFLIKKLGKPFAVLVGVDEYRQLEEARAYFFKKIKTQREKNKKVPYSQVEKDVAKAVNWVRKK